MPKPVAVLDSFVTFGALLKYLRVRVHLNQTELAIAVGYGTAQISRLEHNQRLPDLTMLVALFVPALSLEHEPETVARLLELAAAARGDHLAGRSVTVSHTIRHAHPEEVSEQPVSAARAATPHNAADLATPSTPLIGRDRDLTALCERLLRADVRLLTLAGSPGVGKTRLGMEAARRLNGAFADGAFFVALAPIRDPKLVASAIGQALAVTEDADLPLIEQLKNALRDRHCLLLLDNFEHVLAARALISELLAAAPRLRILVTSRATLHLSAEHEYVVPPLALPDLALLPPLDALAQLPAVALFIARAQVANPAFTFTSGNALSIAAICVHLDGLPLAIELAAARSKLLGPQALLTRLVHRFRLLTGGAHDLPSRHQTLKNALDWSYELLGSAEQRIFERLAVFIGGWRLEAAENVVVLGRDGSGEPSPLHVGRLPSSHAALLDAQALLLDHSLLLHQQTADGEQRLSMLETIREYALERLTERDDIAAAQQQHARYFLILAETAEPELIGPQQSAWFARLEEEHDNLRAALGWMHQTGAAAWELRLAAALWRFWYEHGHLTEGRRRLEQALATSSTPDAEDRSQTTYRAKALNGAGVIAWRQGDMQRAMALLEASLALREQEGDTRGIAQSLSNLGILATERGEHERASDLHSRSLALNRVLSNTWGVAAALLNLGNVAIEQGEYERAIALHEEGLALNREINDTVGIGLSLNNVGVALMMQGNYERAVPLYQESLALQRALGDKLGVSYALNNLGSVALQQGEGRQASALFEESLVLSQVMGNKLCIAESLAGLAMVAQMPAPSLARARRSATLCGFVAALRVAIKAPLASADQAEFDGTLLAARHELGEEACQAALAEGRAMNVDQAIAYALDTEMIEAE